MARLPRGKKGDTKGNGQNRWGDFKSHKIRFSMHIDNIE